MAQFDLLSGLSDLFSQKTLDYLLAPKDTGYDLPKTALYAILLVISAYMIFLILKKIRIKPDAKLAIAAAPFVVFGSCVRVIKDSGAINSFLFVTPGIYAFVFSIFFSVLLASVLLERKFKIPYFKTAFLLGVLTLPFVLAQLSYTNAASWGTVANLLMPWVVVFALVRWPAENKLISLLHIFDATTTFTAVGMFGYYEQHVIPTVLINSLGPFSFVLAKAAIIVGALYAMDRLPVEKEFRDYVKLIVGILGAATGTRDFITLLAGI
jgi:uncharacterized membrane protein